MRIRINPKVVEDLKSICDFIVEDNIYRILNSYQDITAIIFPNKK